MPLKALALNCTPKAGSSETSSTDAMIAVLAAALAKHDAGVSATVRVASLTIRPGVTSDDGEAMTGRRSAAASWTMAS